MGNVFGNVMSYSGPLAPLNTVPDTKKPPTFDANEGFPAERKERVMIATKEEMDATKMEYRHRDYCAHKLIEYRACRKNNFPFVAKCGAEKHHYLECQYEDYVLRMKEFERERRLMERAKKSGSEEE